MKIFSIPDVGSFLGLVRKCRGDVMLHLPDGSQVELKRVIPPAAPSDYVSRTVLLGYPLVQFPGYIGFYPIHEGIPRKPVCQMII